MPLLSRRWTLFALLLSAALWIESTQAAWAANVELGAIGDDGPDFVWCMKARHKVTPGQTFLVTFSGRTTLAGSDNGHINILPETAAHFDWQEILNGNSDMRPAFTFTPTMGPLTGPDPRKITAKSNTPVGLYILEFSAEDSRGSVSPRTRGCTVEVVAALPDAEVVDIRYDPPQAGAPGRTVRMTIRNNMPLTAQPLPGVTWAFVVAGQSGSGLSKHFYESEFATGMKDGVAPGASFQVTALDTAPIRRDASIERVIGRVDPFGFLGENPAERANNDKGMARVLDDGSSVIVPVPHACETGFEEVTTEGGVLGCAQLPGSSGPPPCSGILSSIWGFITGSCSNGAVAYACTVNSDCNSGFICPQSGASQRTCVKGHIP